MKKHETHGTKGKTYEEMYGKEKAKQLKKIRNYATGERNPGKKMKDKTYEEIFGEKEGQRQREIRKGGRKKTGHYEPCSTCGEDVWTYAFEGPNVRKFCNNKCYGIFERDHNPNKGIMVESEFKFCPNCNSKFKTFKKYPQKFCSQKCYVTYRRENPKEFEIKDKNQVIMAKKEHDSEVIKFCDFYRNHGLRTVIISGSGIVPDAIAVNFETKAIYGIEVERNGRNGLSNVMRTKSKKYNEHKLKYLNHSYNGILVKRILNLKWKNKMLKDGENGASVETF